LCKEEEKGSHMVAKKKYSEQVWDCIRSTSAAKISIKPVSVKVSAKGVCSEWTEDALRIPLE
jgi:hypothetical protein